MKKITKNFLILIATFCITFLFLFIYNQYILDRSLLNITISLRVLEQSTDITSATKIKETLENTFIMEVTRDDFDVSSLVKLEFVEAIIAKLSQKEQIEDAKYFLREVATKKAKKRHPFFVKLDEFFARFSRGYKDNYRQILNSVEKLKKELKIYTGELLQKKYLDIVKLYMRIKLWQDAENFCNEAIKINPATQIALRAKLYLGLILKFQRKFKEAREIFSQLRQVFLKELADFTVYQEADVVYKEGKIEEAVSILKETFEKNPSSEIAQVGQFRVGYIYIYDKNDYEKAIREFQKLHHFFDSVTVPTKRDQKVIEHLMDFNIYQRLINHIDTNVTSTISRQLRKLGFELLIEGYNFLKAGKKIEADDKFIEALKQFDTSIKFYPNDAYSYVGKSVGYFFLGNANQAINEAKKAVELASKDPIVLANLGYIYFKLEKYNEAIQQYIQALSFSKTSAFLHYNLGSVYLKAEKDLSKAKYHFEKAIKINPHFFYAYNNLGYVHWLKGSYSEAKYNFEKAISLEPNFIEARYNLGVLLFSIAKFKEAKEEFLIVQKLAPNYRQTSWFLSQIEEKLTKG